MLLFHEMTLNTIVKEEFQKCLSSISVFEASVQVSEDSAVCREKRWIKSGLGGQPLDFS